MKLSEQTVSLLKNFDLYQSEYPVQVWKQNINNLSTKEYTCE